jgi:arylsulfatase A-like enzyme
VFSRAGYDTGYVGKWHLANTTTAVPEGSRGGYEDYWRVADALEHTSHPYEGVVWDENDDPVEFEGYRVDALTDMAVDFIERDRDAPFFLTLSQLEPHHQNDMETYVAPEGYDRKHRNPWMPPDLRGTPGDWHEELPDYYGICERLDECYGRLLDALEREGILKETSSCSSPTTAATSAPGTASTSARVTSRRCACPRSSGGPGSKTGGVSRGRSASSTSRRR